MNEYKLEISDYGLYLLSPKKLESFLKNEKVRGKKILKFFQNNQNKYIKSIKNGVWLPILPINSIEYIIKINESFSEDWIELHQENGFNLEVFDDNDLWVGSISNLLNWEIKNYSQNKDFNSYETLDGETLFNSFRFNISKGKYLVNIKGYKRKEELEYSEANFGFSFELEKIEKFNDYKDPREDDKYKFNIAEMGNGTN